MDLSPDQSSTPLGRVGITSMGFVSSKKKCFGIVIVFKLRLLQMGGARISLAWPTLLIKGDWKGEIARRRRTKLALTTYG